MLRGERGHGRVYHTQNIGCDILSNLTVNKEAVLGGETISLPSFPGRGMLLMVKEIVRHFF